MQVRSARIRDFWEKYFAAAGAHLDPDNYRNMIANPGAGELRGVAPHITA